MITSTQLKTKSPQAATSERTSLSHTNEKEESNETPDTAQAVKVRSGDNRENNNGITRNANGQAIARPQKSSHSFSDIPVHSKAGLLQTKLSVNTPGDEYEQEADAVADKIMRMADGKAVETQPSPVNIIQRKCETCGNEEHEEDEQEDEEHEPVQRMIMRKCAKCKEKEDEEKTLQRKESGHAKPFVSNAVAQTLQSSGQPLTDDSRIFMERRFGFNFSNVRIHDHSLGHRSAKDIHALAYTNNNNIVFGEGQYRPDTEPGKKLLAHELTHVIQQGTNSTKISRANYTVGRSNVNIDYGNVVYHDTITEYDSQLESMFSNYTTQPATLIRSDIVGLTARQKRWLMYAIDLLSDNPLSSFDRLGAVRKLIAYASNTRYDPLIGYDYRTPVFNYENEVLRVSGWFEVALTAGLATPNSAEQRLLTAAYNHAISGSSSPPGSACPARSGTQVLDEPRFRSGLPPLVRTYLTDRVSALTGRGIRTQNIANISPIADIIQQQAMQFFTPYIGNSGSRTFLQSWRYSGHLRQSTSPGVISTDVQRAYLLNRAAGVADENRLFQAVHYDSRCDADKLIFADIIDQLLTEATVQTQLSALLSWQSFTSHGDTHADTVINLQYFSNQNECVMRWKTINTLCHELVHSYVHPNFYNLNRGRRIVTEGLTEVLGDQLYNSIRERANNNSSFRTQFEQGLSAGNCNGVEIPEATLEYGDDGRYAERIRVIVGNDRFCAAYFLGQTLLAGLQPKLEVNIPGDKCEQEADAVAEKIMRQEDKEKTHTRSSSVSIIHRKCPACGKEEELTMTNDASVQKEILQRKCEKCKEEEEEGKLHRKELIGTAPSVSPSVEHTLKSNGKRLDTPTRSFMEQRFGFNFGEVRIHDDAVAHQSAKDINALAYTWNDNIIFNEGQYQPYTKAGKKLLAHELTHVIQQRSVWPQFVQRQPTQTQPTQAELNQLCYAPNQPQPDPPAFRPELHPTYAGWIGSFTGLSTFRSNDTVQGQTARSRFNVLGTGGKRFGDTSATTDTEAVPVTGRVISGEEFIDHPTNQWVMNCLPPNLRATAYQLPADCADIAVILRHVWLSAHHRTETYNGWTVGDATGSANQARARRLIRDVSSGNVRLMVNPYADAQGNTLTDFTGLQNLLHVGDVLVWEHRKVTRSGSRVSSRRTGGHTQTINQIIRNGANISDIKVLQGNQPIFSDAAKAILTARGVRRPDANSPAGRALRDLPGRRIEASRAIGVEVNVDSGVGVRVNNITHPVTGASIWGRIDGQDEFTILIAAGPPRAASRPSASRSAGRRITDWRSRIQSANANSLSGVLEAMLQEARSIIEQGALAINQVTKPDMDALGQAYGTRLKAVFTRNADNLMQRVQEVVTVIRALGNDSTNSTATGPLFNGFENAFVENALPQSTPEERRLFREHASLTNFTSPFATQISGFSASLAAARNMTAARTVSEQHGTQLWQAATARSQAGLSGSNDDRPLYWSRLRMIESIRQTKMFFRISQTDRQQLIEIFENSSRGLPSSSSTSAFSTSTADKRILISGFDPFGLDRDVKDSNPSGATVLALDGQIISANNISAQIEGVIFPVRFRDFDQGMIENFFKPYINGTHTVNMIMTISQGSSHFDIERWAGRRRSDVVADNEGAFSGGRPSNPVEPPGIASGPEFLETALPHKRMIPGSRAKLNSKGRSEDPLTGQSITGTGGGFLSNEIFYRTRLLQTTIGGNALNIPIGHLHVPSNMNRRRITNEIRQILQSALTSI